MSFGLSAIGEDVLQGQSLFQPFTQLGPTDTAGGVRRKKVLQTWMADSKPVAEGKPPR